MAASFSESRLKAARYHNAALTAALENSWIIESANSKLAKLINGADDSTIFHLIDQNLISNKHAENNLKKVKKSLYNFVTHLPLDAKKRVLTRMLNKEDVLGKIIAQPRIKKTSENSGTLQKLALLRELLHMNSSAFSQALFQKRSDMQLIFKILLDDSEAFAHIFSSYGVLRDTLKTHPKNGAAVIDKIINSRELFIRCFGNSSLENLTQDFPNHADVLSVCASVYLAGNRLRLFGDHSPLPTAPAVTPNYQAVPAIEMLDPEMLYLMLNEDNHFELPEDFFEQQQAQKDALIKYIDKLDSYQDRALTLAKALDQMTLLGRFIWLNADGQFIENLAKKFAASLALAYSQINANPANNDENLAQLSSLAAWGEENFGTHSIFGLQSFKWLSDKMTPLSPVISLPQPLNAVPVAATVAVNTAQEKPFFDFDDVPGHIPPPIMPNNGANQDNYFIGSMGNNPATLFAVNGAAQSTDQQVPKPRKPGESFI